MANRKAMHNYKKDSYKSDGGDDVIVCPFDRKWVYFVKSGYHKMKSDAGVRNNRPSTSHIVDMVVWKVIWGLWVPSKIKNFMWRLCNNALLVGEALWKRSD